MINNPCVQNKAQKAKIVITYNCSMAPSRVFQIALAVGVGIFALAIINSLHGSNSENNGELEHQSKTEFHREEHEKVLGNENTVHVSVLVEHKSKTEFHQEEHEELLGDTNKTHVSVLMEHQSKTEFHQEKHEELRGDANKTHLSVYQCLQLKTELEPFNLLLALNRSIYDVADFTPLNIEDIRQCLSFLEAFQQKVRQMQPAAPQHFLSNKMQIYERDVQLKRLIYQATTADKRL
jgi:hypothetical protein